MERWGLSYIFKFCQLGFFLVGLGSPLKAVEAMEGGECKEEELAEIRLGDEYSPLPATSEQSLSQLICEMERENPTEAEIIKTKLVPTIEDVKKYYNSKTKKSSRRDIENWVAGHKKDSSKTQQVPLVQTLAVLMRVSELCSPKGAPKITPRDTQLLAVLSALSSTLSEETPKNIFLQVATGEGKTLITQMIAAARALRGDKVDIVSSGNTLAARDAEKGKPFYDLLKLTSASIPEGTLEKREAYRSDIIYSTLHTLQADVLRERTKKVNLRSERPHDVLVVDEADSMLVDRVSQKTLLSEPMPGTERFYPIYGVIWAVLTAMDEAEVRDLAAQRSTLPQKRKHLLKVLGSILRGEHKDFQFNIPERLLAIAEVQKDLWVDKAIEAFYNLREEREYVAKDIGEVHIVDFEHTGETQTRMHWSDGLHQFVQMKHHACLTREMLISSFISTLSLVDLYKKGGLYGLTGTLGDEMAQHFMKTVYGVGFMKVPLFRAKRFVELTPIIHGDEQSWQEGVLADMTREAQKGRAVLGLFETIEELNKFKEVLKTQYDPARIKCYLDSENKAEQELIEGEFEGGDVILSTNLAGRGTDLRLSDDVEAKGGLHVCLTFLPANERVEQQALGRTARQGKAGSARIVLNRRGLRDIYKPYTTLDAIREERARTEHQNLLRMLWVEVPRMREEDDWFAVINNCLRELRTIKYNPNAPSVGFYWQEGKIEQLQELWAIQLKLIQNCEYNVLRRQEDVLQGVLHEKGVEAPSMDQAWPHSLYAHIARFVPGKTAARLEEEVMLYVWHHIAQQDEERFQEVLPRYLEPSDEWFELVSGLTNLTMAVLNQQGHARVYKRGSELALRLAEVTGGPDAESSQTLSPHWGYMEMPKSSPSLQAAMAHQLYLNEILPPTFLPQHLQPRGGGGGGGGDSLLEGVTPQERVAQLSLENWALEILQDCPIPAEVNQVGANGENKRVYPDSYFQSLARTYNCVVALTNLAQSASSPEMPYTYYFVHQGRVQKVVNKAPPAEVGHLPVCRLFHDIETDVFKSIIADPCTPLTAAALPTVFDVSRFYRGFKPALAAPRQPTHVPASYAVLQVVNEERVAALNAVIDEAAPLPDINDLPAYEEAASFALKTCYARLGYAYYKRKAQEHTEFVSPILDLFQDKAKKLYAREQGLLISVRRACEIGKLSDFALADRLYALALSADPAGKYIIHYNRAHKAVADKHDKTLAGEELKKAKSYLQDGIEPFGFVLTMLKRDRSVAEASPIMKQMQGYVAYFEALHQNIEQNINMTATELVGGQRLVPGGGKEALDYAKKFNLPEADAKLLEQSGIDAFYMFEIRPPEPSLFESFCMLALGVLQVAVGVALAMTGAGVSLGSFLAGEGLSDVFKGLSGDVIDWAGHFIGKGISAIMFAATNAVKVITEYFKSGEFYIKDICGLGGKAQALGDFTYNIVRNQGVKFLAGQATNFIKTNVMKIIEQEVNKKAHQYCLELKADTTFMDNLKKLIVFQQLAHDPGSHGLHAILQDLQKWGSQSSSFLQASKYVQDILDANSGEHAALSVASAVLTAANIGFEIYKVDGFLKEYYAQILSVVGRHAAALPTLNGLMAANANFDNRGSKIKEKEAEKWSTALEKEGIFKGARPYVLVASLEECAEGVKKLDASEDYVPHIKAANPNALHSSGPKAHVSAIEKAFQHFVSTLFRVYAGDEAGQGNLIKVATEQFMGSIRHSMASLLKGKIEMGPLASIGAFVHKGMSHFVNKAWDGAEGVVQSLRLENLREKKECEPLSEAEEKLFKELDEKVRAEKAFAKEEEELTPQEKEFLMKYQEQQLAKHFHEEEEKYSQRIFQRKEEKDELLAWQKRQSDEILFLNAKMQQTGSLTLKEEGRLKSLIQERQSFYEQCAAGERPLSQEQVTDMQRNESILRDVDQREQRRKQLFEREEAARKAEKEKRAQTSPRAPPKATYNPEGKVDEEDLPDPEEGRGAGMGAGLAHLLLAAQEEDGGDDTRGPPEERDIKNIIDLLGLSEEQKLSARSNLDLIERRIQKLVDFEKLFETECESKTPVLIALWLDEQRKKAESNKDYNLAEIVSDFQYQFKNHQEKVLDSMTPPVVEKTFREKAKDRLWRDIHKYERLAADPNISWYTRFWYHRVRHEAQEAYDNMLEVDHSDKYLAGMIKGAEYASYVASGVGICRTVGKEGVKYYLKKRIVDEAKSMAFDKAAEVTGVKQKVTDAWDWMSSFMPEATQEDIARIGSKYTLGKLQSATEKGVSFAHNKLRSAWQGMHMKDSVGGAEASSPPSSSGQHGHTETGAAPPGKTATGRGGLEKATSEINRAKAHTVKAENVSFHAGNLKSAGAQKQTTTPASAAGYGASIKAGPKTTARASLGIKKADLHLEASKTSFFNTTSQPAWQPASSFAHSHGHTFTTPHTTPVGMGARGASMAGGGKPAQPRVASANDYGMSYTSAPRYYRPTGASSAPRGRARPQPSHRPGEDQPRAPPHERAPRAPEQPEAKSAPSTHETPASQGGGGGGGGPQATYQKPSNKPASDAGRVEKPSLREKVGEKLKKGVTKEGGEYQKTSAKSKNAPYKPRVSAGHITPEEFRELGFRGGVITKGPHAKKDNWLRAHSESMGGAKTRKELSEKVKKEFFNEKGRPRVSQILNNDGSTSKLYVFPDKSTITIGRDGGGGPKLEISNTVRKTFEKITFKE